VIYLSDIYKCGSCGESVTISEEHIELIKKIVWFVIWDTNIDESKKAIFIDKTESEIAMKRKIISEQEIISVMLNKIFVCCQNPDWKIQYEL